MAEAVQAGSNARGPGLYLMLLQVTEGEDRRRLRRSSPRTHNNALNHAMFVSLKRFQNHDKGPAAL